MTHDELLAKIDIHWATETIEQVGRKIKALRAVVELHKPTEYGDCSHCFGLHSMGETYPCPTIQAIEKELA